MDSSFVDSNVYVYLLMGDPIYSTRALRILESFEQGNVMGWTSTLALSQTFSHLKKRRKYSAMDKFYDYLENSPVRVTETTMDDLNKARSIKEAQGLPWSMWDDLVLASQMQRLGLSEIYSNDKDFDRIQGVKRSF